MAQSPKGGLFEPPSKGHVGVCAIYCKGLANYRECSQECLLGPIVVALRAGKCKLACISLERIHDVFAGTPSLEIFDENQQADS